MNLDVISYDDLIDPTKTHAHKILENALLHKGIVGIRNVPTFSEKSQRYVDAAIQFTGLAEAIKLQYAPNRAIGDTDGYEFGNEKFKNKEGIWQVDTHKESFYASVPDLAQNKWPAEVDFKTPFLALGELIFSTGKSVLDVLGLNKKIGLDHTLLKGYGRMLRYHGGNLAGDHSEWCGEHYDHGLFTGLMPAYYFRNGKEVSEPDSAGLYISSDGSSHFEKVIVPDKSIMLFQVGEFGQIVSDDRIRATKHLVKQTDHTVERFAFALFYSVGDGYLVKSQSMLTKDKRYSQNQNPDGSIGYKKWDDASFERYRVI